LTAQVATHSSKVACTYLFGTFLSYGSDTLTETDKHSLLILATVDNSFFEYTLNQARRQIDGTLRAKFGLNICSICFALTSGQALPTGVLMKEFGKWKFRHGGSSI
jgi:hypothetical protein